MGVTEERQARTKCAAVYQLLIYVRVRGKLWVTQKKPPFHDVCGERRLQQPYNFVTVRERCSTRSCNSYDDQANVHLQPMPPTAPTWRLFSVSQWQTFTCTILACLRHSTDLCWYAPSTCSVSLQRQSHSAPLNLGARLRVTHMIACISKRNASNR